MQPIKWNGITEENAGTNSSPNSSWYNYTAQTGALDGKTSNWANVKLEDGSYFVWIPRYGYKIIYFDSEDHANNYRENGLTNENSAWIQGYSTVYGMINKNKRAIEGSNPNISYKVKTEGFTDYVPHPAFLGTGYEDLGGGFGDNNKGVEGFWIAKYEMSAETNGSPTSFPGNVATSSSIKMASKPNVRSWTGINVANMYENAKNYDTNLVTPHSDYDSHLIKGSEWGAVAYLTYSKYGRNGSEIRINNNADRYTGWGATSHNLSSEQYNASLTDNLYTGQYGQLASTSGNITGVYDMSGGCAEYASVFNKAYTGEYFSGTDHISAQGTHFAATGKNSTKYETAYYNTDTTSNIHYVAHYFTNEKVISKVGDGTVEVYTDVYTAWAQDSAGFVRYNYPFLKRGGYAYNRTCNGNLSHDRWGVLCLQQRILPCRIHLLTQTLLSQQSGEQSSLFFCKSYLLFQIKNIQ